MRYITIIGSRETTATNMARLQKAANLLVKFGYTLRSGGADGADTVVTMMNCAKEIFIPWGNFNKMYHNPDKGIYDAQKFPNYRRAQMMAKKIHPAPDKLSRGALSLHTRNVYQVMGPSLSKAHYSRLVVYSANEVNGVVKGGTATAVHLARKLNIPTVNVNIDKEFNEFLAKLMMALKNVK